MRKRLKVCWLSAGVSSFVAGWLARDSIDEFIYIDIADQHPDSLWFIHDCEKALDKEIKILRSTQYRCVGDVCRAFRFVASAYGAKCTEVLKKRVRKEWEYEHRGDEITYVWGMDLNEKARAENLRETMAEFRHEFPLIDRGLSKADAHGICAKLGIKRPAMYDMGYSNKIRVDFPEVFADRAKMEREIGHAILRNESGPIYLDELDPSAGRMADEIMDDCNIFCMLSMEH